MTLYISAIIIIKIVPERSVVNVISKKTVSLNKDSYEALQFHQTCRRNKIVESLFDF